MKIKEKFRYKEGAAFSWPHATLAIFENQGLKWKIKKWKKVAR